ncbi:MAG: hypothetical protein RLY20_1483 [Verrucomicrobiota bacterium]
MKHRTAIVLVGLLLALAGQLPAFACAACYGQSNSDLAKGMNAGILVLLAFIGFILVGVASFAIYLIRRSATAAAPAAEVAAAATAQPVTSTKI